MRRVIVLYSQPDRFVRLDPEHKQRDGKSVNHGLPLMDLPEGRDSWCGPNGAGPLGTRMNVDSSVQVIILSMCLCVYANGPVLRFLKALHEI